MTLEEALAYRIPYTCATLGDRKENRTWMRERTEKAVIELTALLLVREATDSEDEEIAKFNEWLRRIELQIERGRKGRTAS